jgi:hypothetical protein
MKVTGKAMEVREGADALTQLKARFAGWRAGRKLGMRIPPELWTAAVEEVAVHGAYRVARALNLDYDMLKQRAAVAGRKATTATGDKSPVPRRTGELAPRFVELFAAGGAMPAPSACAPQCVVELANSRGGRMRVELSGQGLVGLSALCGAFLGAP